MYRQTTLFDFWKVEESDQEDDQDNSDEEDGAANDGDPTERFKNMYWSRIVSVQEYDGLEQQRWLMQADV